MTMNWPPKRILVGTDFSASSEAALFAAAALARRCGSQVELVHALHPRTRPIAGFEPLDVLISPDPVDELEATQARVSELARGIGPDLCHARVVEGEPVSALVAERDRLAADLVVLGAGGLHGMRHFFLGSVAEKMLAHPGCPLLLVSRTASAGEFKRVLIAQENPRAASAWLEVGMRLAHDERSEVIALHVIPARGEAARKLGELEQHRVPARLARCLSQLDTTVPTQVVVRSGDPGREIVRAAHEFGADLVVLGAERNRADGGAGPVVAEITRSHVPAFLVVWPESESDEEFELQ
jgi:nucleotide-binding universal stress UspA family protein